MLDVARWTTLPRVAAVASSASSSSSSSSVGAAAAVNARSRRWILRDHPHELRRYPRRAAVTRNRNKRSVGAADAEYESKKRSMPLPSSPTSSPQPRSDDDKAKSQDGVGTGTGGSGGQDDQIRRRQAAPETTVTAGSSRATSSCGASHHHDNNSDRNNCDRNHNNHESSESSSFWEAAEGGNSHELTVDEIDDARRRVESLFPNPNGLLLVVPASLADPHQGEESRPSIAAIQVSAADLAVPQFDLAELSLGKFLGRGGFSNVHEIRWIRCRQGDGDKDFEVEVASASARHFLAEHCTRPSGEARYAIKQARPGPSDGNGGESSADKKKPDGGSSDNNHKKKYKYEAGSSQNDPQQNHLQVRRRSLVGRMDLATEAEFLRRLEHPNIVKLRGTARGDVLSPGYFLIVDRLCETLHSRLQAWKEQSRQLRRSSGSSVSRLVNALVRRCSFGAGGGGGGGSGPSSSRSDPTTSRAAGPPDPHQWFWCTRLSAACDLASAIEYLHERRIIHRDIKPTNIGFDIRGDLKIFDFGMARVLDPRDAHKDDGTYSNLSHMTGSLRYMAPEVALGLPYHTSCDVYSLSLVVWEMLALKKPYQAPSAMPRGRAAGSAATADEAAFRYRVFENKTRPPLPSDWPSGIRHLVSGGWAHELSDRLDVHELSAGLVSELLVMTGRHDRRSSDPNDVLSGPCSLDTSACPLFRPDRRRRRSTHVFRPPPPSAPVSVRSPGTLDSDGEHHDGDDEPDDDQATILSSQQFVFPTER